MNCINHDEKLRYLTEDSHIVRSRGELIIDNWLYHHNFSHSYEEKVYYNEKRFITSDWYINSLDLYIEYWGKMDPEYISHREFKEYIYKKLNLKVISIEDVDIQYLDQKLNMLLLQRQKKGRSIGRNDHHLTLDELDRFRLTKNNYLMGYYIVASVIKEPKLGKSKKSNSPNVLLMLQDMGGFAKVQVWGNYNQSNLKTAQSLRKGSKIVITDPVLPAMDYQYSDLWVNERVSKLKKLN